jgi:hypothetical protein
MVHAYEYDGDWWFGIVLERRDSVSYVQFMQPHGSDSNFLWPQRDDCCLIEDNNVLLVINTPSTETDQT